MKEGNEMAQAKKTTEEKTTEVKAAPAKTTAAKTTKTATKTTKTAAKAAEPAKAEVKAEAKTTAAKKAPAKKAPAKKTTKKAEPKVSVVIEFDGGQEAVDSIVENVKATYAANGGKEDIKTLEIFVKPEERKAYFVVNGELDSNNQMDVYF